MSDNSTTHNIVLRRYCFALGVLIIVSSAGCASNGVELRSVAKSPLVERFKLTSRGGPQVSSRTMQVLRTYGLADDLKNKPGKLLEKLYAIVEREPTLDGVYAISELSYLGGKRIESRKPKAALDLYGASVLYAYRYLFDERTAEYRNQYDPQFRHACDLYNGALEAGLRLICKGDGLVPGKKYSLKTATGTWDIRCVLLGRSWKNEDIDHFKFASDYEIKGLKNYYRGHGLGVPLIAVRRSYSGEPTEAQFYPVKLSFPVTAIMRPVAGLDANGQSHQEIVLELHDPFATAHATIGWQRVPLESDLSTPLAYTLSDKKLEALATVGLLWPELLLKMRPDRPEPIMGLYMMQPYDPNKIPVLLIHGLWSSPITWMDMFNDLRNSPEICDRYQFWFYLYPTGQPFLVSAAQLRRDLAVARHLLDPNRQSPALDQMVLVGHSMGGLVARLQTINSGNDYWNLVSDKPFSVVKADPELRKGLADSFFFQPNASVRRVITIGTPHRGSDVSNDFTRWLTSKMIQLPRTLVQTTENLFRENKDIFRNKDALLGRTSIDSLSPSSPVFPVMLSARHMPWVKYHNVIAKVPNDGFFGKIAAGTDGVVSYNSAHLDNVNSELVVTADHTTVHSHPKAILEVRRVLLEHLSELRGTPGPVGGVERTVGLDESRR